MALVTSITFTGILIYVGVFSFFTLFILKQKPELENFAFDKIDMAFLIYIFVFSLTKLVNSGYEEGLNTFFRTCQDYFIFLWLVIYVRNNENNGKVIKFGILIASILAISYGLSQLFGFDFFHRQENIHRLSGFHKNPYTYGGQLIIIFFFLLNKCNGNSKSLINYILPFMCFLCVLNTSERAVIIAILAGVLVYIFLNRAKRLNILILSFLLLIPAIITNLLNKKVFKRMKSALTNGVRVKRNIRFRLWGIAIAIWKRNWLFGLGKFPKVYYEINDKLPVQVLKHAHNVYFQILVTNGVLGLIAFLNLFLSFLRVLFANIRTNQYAVILISVITAFSIEGIFEYVWGDSEVRYFFLYFTGFVFGNLLDYKFKKV